MVVPVTGVLPIVVVVVGVSKTTVTLANVVVVVVSKTTVILSIVVVVVVVVSETTVVLPVGLSCDDAAIRVKFLRPASSAK